MIADLQFYAATVPAVILYGLSKGGLSGVSLLAMPLMSLVMSPLQAAAILLPVLLVQDAVTVYTFRDTWDRTTLVHVLPGALLGISVGFVTAALVSTAQIKLAVGTLAIALVLNAWFGAKPAGPEGLPHSWPKALGLAGLSGYSSFVIHAGGAPYNMYTLPRIRDRQIFVGTSAIFFALVNLLKVPPYIGLGQFTLTNLKLSAILCPIAILASMLGIWVVRTVPNALFYKIVYGLTFVVGLKLIYDGVSAV